MEIHIGGDDWIDDAIAAINETIKKSNGEGDVLHPYTRHAEFIDRRIVEDSETWCNDPLLKKIALKRPRIEPQYLFDSPCHRIIEEGAGDACVS